MNFKLNDVEQQRASEFSDQHSHEDVYKGAIGGHLTYSFAPNSIGCSVCMRCAICKQEENITDYDVW